MKDKTLLHLFPINTCINRNVIRLNARKFSKKNSLLLINLVQGFVGKEPVRKPDILANTSTFKYFLHNVTIQIKNFSRSFTRDHFQYFQCIKGIMEKTRTDPKDKSNITRRTMQACIPIPIFAQ